ncbi:MAG: hypothetical protein IPN90_05730 [Elusimicrobia bacterium]|nr:hypothetical protein [Elusimicrobiota bacterium]
MPVPSDSSPLKKPRLVPSTHPGRALFRVEFPFGKRPVLTWETVRYEVLDISERGMRVSVEGRKPFASGVTVRTDVCFEDSKETVAGKVLRGNEQEAVFQLTEGFPLERIRREERRLIRATLPPQPPPPKS